MDMLKINDSLTTDESIEEYEYHEYEPITGSNLNNPGEIRITVQTQDIFYHPSESYLIFEGQLVKKDGTAYADADVVTITNNGMIREPLVLEYPSNTFSVLLKIMIKSYTDSDTF